MQNTNGMTRYVMEKWIKVWVASALCLIVALSAVAEETTFEYPPTKAGAIAKSYIEAFNSGKEEKMKEFSERYRSAESLAKSSAKARAKNTKQLHKQMGTLQPALVTEETETSITITARSEKLGMWLSCLFTLEAAEPFKMVSVAIRPTGPPQPTGGGAVSGGSLREMVDQLRGVTGVPAVAVGVIEGGEVSDVFVTGVRERGKSDRVGPNERFHIGSLTKSMTAMVIGALVDQEKLDWETTIGEVLADMQMNEAYRRVTVEQLLQHRSGLGGFLVFSEEEEERLAKLTGSATEQRATFVAEVLLSAPEKQVGEFGYSNAGYTVVGLMGERVSGKSWEDLVTEIVFDPLKMEHSGFGWPATRSRPDEPRGHFSEATGYRAQPIGSTPLGNYLSPAGNVNTSIGDLSLYAAAQLSALAGKDGPVTSKTVKRLHAPMASDGQYAGGWMLSEKPGTGVVHSHQGSAGTFLAVIELYPEQNRAICIAMNVGTDGLPVADKILDLVNSQAKK